MKVVLMNSGGIDSRVSAAALAADGHEVYSLYVNWNPRNRQAAQEAARVTADTYCVRHEVLPWGADWMSRMSFGGIGMPFTAGLSVAVPAAYACHVDAQAVASGLLRQEAASGGRATATALLHGSVYSGTFDLLLPVWEMSESEVAATAVRLGVDLLTTYSCNEGEEPCGRCVHCPCHERVIAFWENAR
jgi:7-cyano-7-deazaguanine synthase in queuosine biosynthesis